MADNAADELARNIARNIVPLDAGKDVLSPYQKAESGIMRLLQAMGITQQPAPSITEPLPRINPATGQVEFPPGYKGPR